ncbi:EEIG1/EHBP1 N-terminal domain-containing protein, partial [Tanacetum coccineum]
ILGEATVNLADYVDAPQPAAISLPLVGSDHGTILHVSVQLLTAKTGFKEFEQQRDKGLQSGNNIDKETESNTARSSSFELEMLDDREMNKSKVSASQRPPTEKLHKDVAIDFEENHRLRGSLKTAGSSITELKMELSLLQKVTFLKPEFSKLKTDLQKLTEMKSSSQFMERNIKKSDHVKNFKWVDEVLLVEDQIRNLKEKVYAGSHEPNLSFFEVLFNTVQDLKKEIVDPESMLPSGKLPSPPLEKLLVAMGLLRISETYSIILLVLLPCKFGVKLEQTIIHIWYNMVEFLASSTALVHLVCGNLCLKHIAHVSLVMGLLRISETYSIILIVLLPCKFGVKVEQTIIHIWYNMVEFLASSTDLVHPVCGNFCLKHIAHVSFGDVQAVDGLCQRLLTPLLLNEDSLKEGNSPGGITDSSFEDGVQRALVGGDSLWESTLDQYLKNNSSPYLKFYNFVSAGQQVVSTMVNNDLVILVNTRPQKPWKETLDLLCNGSAEVLFARRSDAFQALKQYNNVQLDGRPMRIEIEGFKYEIPISACVNVVGGLN